MTSLYQAALLGFLQGLTEFLPVSSSGHLLLAEALLDVTFSRQAQGLFDVMVHAGTLLAILLLYRAGVGEFLRGMAGVIRRPLDGPRVWLSRPDQRLFVLLLVASLPALLVVLGLHIARVGEVSAMEHITGLLRDAGCPQRGAALTGSCLLLTALLLALTARSRGQMTALDVRLALLMGLMQALALLPGVSRSGTTIAVALLCGLPREEAARFSFLMAVPAIVGACVYELLAHPPALSQLHLYVVGLLVSFLAGLGSLMLLVGMVRRGRLAWFAPYCLGLGLLALGWSVLTGPLSSH